MESHVLPLTTPLPPPWLPFEPSAPSAPWPNIVLRKKSMPRFKLIPFLPLIVCDCDVGFNLFTVGLFVLLWLKATSGMFVML